MSIVQQKLSSRALRKVDCPLYFTLGFYLFSGFFSSNACSGPILLSSFECTAIFGLVMENREVIGTSSLEPMCSSKTLLYQKSLSFVTMCRGNSHRTIPKNMGHPRLLQFRCQVRTVRISAAQTLETSLKSTQPTAHERTDHEICAPRLIAVTVAPAVVMVIAVVATVAGVLTTET